MGKEAMVDLAQRVVGACSWFRRLHVTQSYGIVSITLAFAIRIWSSSGALGPSVYGVLCIGYTPVVLCRPVSIVVDVPLPSNYAAARGLRHVSMQGLYTKVQQPPSSETEIPEQFARSTRLAIPVARLIPAEVSNIALTSFMTATAWFADARAAIAYVDPDDVGEVVSSDLPPVWVPLAVVATLVAGIGLLQGSLGDVMNDEAKLGGMSGARAAKQSTRDRSMFKKKNEGS